MKAQVRWSSLDLESPFIANKPSSTAPVQATTSAHAGTAPMEVDAEAGSRSPTMGTRLNAEGQWTAVGMDDEFLLRMAMDCDAPVEALAGAPAEALADTRHGYETGQHRPRLNWPPLVAGYPMLVVPAERLEMIRIAGERGLLVPAQQGLSGPGLDAPLRAHCMAPPIIAAPAMPGPTLSEEDNDGPSVSIEIATKLLECRHALAATGSAPLQDLFELLAENGGARHSRFVDGEPARIDITLKLVDLLIDMVAMHGTPQARFDQESLDRFGLSLLQWCGRSSYSLRKSEQVKRYSVGMHDMVDENIINTIVLTAMCRSEKTRDFILGIFNENEVELRENFRMSTKIKILRQSAAGEIALNAAETLALCTLRLSYNSSADRLLFMIRSHAGQLLRSFMSQAAGQGTSAGLVMQ